MNSEVAELYLSVLDDLYQQESLTIDLEGNENQVMVDGYGNFHVAKIDMDGLGDFNRGEGYSQGTSKFSWEKITMEKERSQELRIDRLTNGENLDLPFSMLGGEFIRTKVIPETDAARIAKLYGYEGVNLVEETLSTAEETIKALRKALNAMDDAEVPKENRILYIKTSLYSAIDDLDTIKSKKVLERFSKIVPMPSRRMYTAIKMNDGKDTAGNSKFGYEKAEGAHAGNFLIVDKQAVIAKTAQFLKYFTPEEDQKADDHVFKYRNNNLYAYIYENKKSGVYGSYAPDQGGE